MSTLFIAPIIYGITLVLGVIGGLAGVFALIDVSTRRPDAFAAADKQTKSTWVGITVACAVVLVIGGISPTAAVFGPPDGILWLGAVVGNLVYLLDVRPRLREVQRGNRW